MSTSIGRATGPRGFLNRWNDTLATDLEEVPREVGERVLGEEWDAGTHVADE